MLSLSPEKPSRRKNTIIDPLGSTIATKDLYQALYNEYSDNGHHIGIDNCAGIFHAFKILMTERNTVVLCSKCWTIGFKRSMCNRHKPQNMISLSKIVTKKNLSNDQLFKKFLKYAKEHNRLAPESTEELLIPRWEENNCCLIDNETATLTKDSSKRGPYQKTLSKRIMILESELKRTKDELDITLKKLKAAQDELKSERAAYRSLKFKFDHFVQTFHVRHNSN